MYYLLENNRIIETIKEYEVEYIIDPYFNSKNEYKFVYVKDLYYQDLQVLRNSTTEETIGFIKKQSENVYDLIDWEQDLVKVDDNIFCCKYFYSKEEYLTNKWFNAIYKPNSKGDYIKVWEKK